MTTKPRVFKTPCYKRELSIYEKETLDKIQVFRVARTNWHATHEGEEASTTNKHLLKETNLYKGRSRCLRMLRVKTTYIRKHYKTLRPIPYWTLKKKVAEGDLSEGVILRKTYRKVIKKEPPPDGIEKIWTREDMEKCQEEVTKIASRRKRRQKKKECREKAVKGPCKTALKKLKAAKLKEGIIESCRCEDGREVTVVIKGICLCDKTPLNNIDLGKVCDEYSKIKSSLIHKFSEKPAPTEPTKTPEEPSVKKGSGDNLKKKKKTSDEENSSDLDLKVGLGSLRMHDSVRVIKSKNVGLPFKYSNELTDGEVTDDVLKMEEKKHTFENERFFKGAGGRKVDTESELTMYRNTSSEDSMMRDSETEHEPELGTGKKTKGEIFITESHNLEVLKEEGKREVKPEEKKIPREVKPEEKKIPREVKPEEKKIPREVKPEEMKIPREVKPEEKKIPREVKPEEMKIPREVKPEEMKIPREVKPEEMKIPREVKPEEMKIPREVKPEEMKIPREVKPEEMKIPREVTESLNNLFIGERTVKSEQWADEKAGAAPASFKNSIPRLSNSIEFHKKTLLQKSSLKRNFNTRRKTDSSEYLFLKKKEHQIGGAERRVRVSESPSRTAPKRKHFGTKGKIPWFRKKETNVAATASPPDNRTIDTHYDVLTDKKSWTDKGNKKTDPSTQDLKSVGPASRPTSAKTSKKTDPSTQDLKSVGAASRPVIAKRCKKKDRSTQDLKSVGAASRPTSAKNSKKTDPSTQDLKSVGAASRPTSAKNSKKTDPSTQDLKSVDAASRPTSAKNSKKTDPSTQDLKSVDAASRTLIEESSKKPDPNIKPVIALGPEKDVQSENDNSSMVTLYKNKPELKSEMGLTEEEKERMYEVEKLNNKAKKQEKNKEQNKD